MTGALHVLSVTGQPRFAATVFLRNLHPQRTVYLPLRPGWVRVLRPAVTTCIPAALLHTPAVRQLVVHGLVEPVTEVNAGADAKAAAALRRDMARAIAAAEQREFDKLRVGVTIAPERRPASARSYRRADMWPEADLALLRQRRSEGVPLAAIAAELGRPEVAVMAMASRRGFHGPERFWTEARKTLLRQRWAQGAHWPEIAAELGVSRGQLLGQAFRLGLRPGIRSTRPPGGATAAGLPQSGSR